VPLLYKFLVRASQLEPVRGVAQAKDQTAMKVVITHGDRYSGGVFTVRITEDSRQLFTNLPPKIRIDERIRTGYRA
jgi:hypothetical protein